MVIVQKKQSTSSIWPVTSSKSKCLVSMITCVLNSTCTYKENLYYSGIYLIWNTVLVASVHLCLSIIYHIESMKKHKHVYLELIPISFCVKTWQETVGTLRVPVRCLLALQWLCHQSVLHLLKMESWEQKVYKDRGISDSICLQTFRIDSIKMKNREYACDRKSRL